MKVTSSPARTICAPQYPPTAPAPTIAILFRGIDPSFERPAPAIPLRPRGRRGKVRWGIPGREPCCLYDPPHPDLLRPLGVKAGEMVDRCSGTYWTGGARPGSPQEGPAHRVATGKSLAERCAGGAWEPSGASGWTSRSRRRLGEIKAGDIVAAEEHIESAVGHGGTEGHLLADEGAA